MFCTITQQNDPIRSRTRASRPSVQRTNHWATASPKQNKYIVVILIKRARIKVCRPTLEEELVRKDETPRDFLKGDIT